MNDRQDPPSPDDWPGDRPHDPVAPYGTGGGYAPGSAYPAAQPPDATYPPGDYPHNGYPAGDYQQPTPAYGYDGYAQPVQPTPPAHLGQPGDASGYPARDPYPRGQDGYAPYGGQHAARPGQGDPYGQGQSGYTPGYDPEPYGTQPPQGFPTAYAPQQPQGYPAAPDYPGQSGHPAPSYPDSGAAGSASGTGTSQTYGTGGPGHAAPASGQPQPDAYGYDAYAAAPRTATHRRVPRQTQPEQASPGQAAELTQPERAEAPRARPGPPRPDQPQPDQGAARPGQTRARARRAPQTPEAERPEPAGAEDDPTRAAPSDDYRTEQFSFIEEPDEESEDVIDWLKFAETRSERRDERKRKLRTRLIGLVAVLALVVGCGVGYLWYADKLPGVSSGGDAEASASGQQQRKVIVVHLRETKGGGSSSALLVDNETTRKGSTVLLPNALAVAGENGTTTLGNAVQDEGAGGTRDALTNLLGSEIQGTWRLDTPYLENLVELVGGITLDTDVLVPAAKEGEDPLVKRGSAVQLGGQGAVAYATHLEPGEDQAKQLTRFGQVLGAVLAKVSTDAGKATATVEQLAQIPDPSLSEKQLGTALAALAQRAEDGAYETDLLAVRPDGTLSEEATENVVKDVLGGSVKKPDDAAQTAARVSVRNATGDERKAGAAQVALVNGGFTFVGGGNGTAEATSRVTYADAAQAGQAKEVAATLGLPESAVRQGKGAANADVTVVLGGDYAGQRG
ncbi:LytR C-terminal domain-containing protein [Streptomyces sp. NPDC057702]|uniref:LytR C-terminal domain-containing protein n=1 Tax=unclassified Streptomyces TaxID=2593676 RepID=UPI0036B590EA